MTHSTARIEALERRQLLADAGNTLATATNIGDLLGQRHFVDSLSSSDTNDFYKFSLPVAGTISASFGTTAFLTDADLQLIQDTNNNGAINAGDVLAASLHIGNSGESLSRASAAGTYFIRVFQRMGTPIYDLTLTSDTAGSTLPTARNMGLSGFSPSTIEFVGPSDAADFFKVDVPFAAQFNVFLSLLSDKVTLRIIRDANSNNVVDAGEVLVSKIVGTSSNRSAVNVLGPGPVFVGVVNAGTVGTNYGIQIAEAPVDNAGNTLVTARDIGVLGAQQTFGDFVGDGSINATDDLDDFYRFTLGSNGPYRLDAKIVTDGGDEQLTLIRDSNSNFQIDSGEVLTSTTGTTPSHIVTTLDTLGTYYLRLSRESSQVSYSLSASAASLDTAGNTLGTARALGAIGSVSINEFVGRIDTDDFYSFQIANPTTLSANLGAATTAQQLEIIQDTNNNGVVDSGDILASTAASSGTVLSAGLAVAIAAPGTYFAHVLANGSDSNYSMSLGVTLPKTGTFAITPRNTIVRAGQSTKLALRWTVPSGSWHLLDDIELRIRDERGTILRLKWNESAGTFSLYNPHSHKFGPAKKPGSNGVLSNRYVKLRLHSSSIKGEGPTAPSVVLTFDLTFKKAATGRQYVVEAAARNDLGNRDDFAIGASLEVI